MIITFNTCFLRMFILYNIYYIHYTTLPPLFLSRKEQEYQDALRLQIEEKKRAKEVEKREQEEIKRKELEEYLRSQYKGEVPAHLAPVLAKRKNTEESESNNSYSVGGRGDAGRRNSDVDDHKFVNSSPKGRRRKSDVNMEDDNELSVGRKHGGVRRAGGINGSNRRGGSDEEDNYSGNDDEGGHHKNSRVTRAPPRSMGKQKSSGSQHQRNRADSDDEDYSDAQSINNYDDNSDDDRINRMRINQKKNNGNGRHSSKRNDANNMVTTEEYDELSQLCDRLLSQQEDLQSEIRQQARLIKV